MQRDQGRTAGEGMSDIFDSNMMVKTHDQNTINSQITAIKKPNVFYALYIQIFFYEGYGISTRQRVGRSIQKDLKGGWTNNAKVV